jgi:hypothetical protein
MVTNEVRPEGQLSPGEAGQTQYVPGEQVEGLVHVVQPHEPQLCQFLSQAIFPMEVTFCDEHILESLSESIDEALLIIHHIFIHFHFRSLLQL